MSWLLVIIYIGLTAYSSDKVAYDSDEFEKNLLLTAVINNGFLYA